jgi:membrane associated rhomboid family serine protease
MLDVTLLTRVGIVAMVGAGLAFGVSLFGRARLWEALTDRLLYGVPWGSLVVITGVFAFYLFGQNGLTHWNSPVTLPFRNWAYPYATGMVSSGFAHNSPGHLLGNMLATVVFAPIAEFIWGHYTHDPPDEIATPGRPSDDETVPDEPAPTEFDGTRGERAIPSPAAHQSDDESREGQAHTTADEETQLRDSPGVRALVIFPAVVVLVSLLTSLYALGWSLGFSGTVFAFMGFVLIRYPIPAAVGILGISILNTVLNTLLTPVLRATAQSGPPRPPSWAGINVQAHMLGFLVGVLLALALLWTREERPDGPRLFLGTVLIAFVQGLWQLSTASNGEFVRYQGIGVIFVLLLAILVTYVAVATNAQIGGWAGTLLRGAGGLWLTLVVLGAAGVVALLDASTMTVLTVAIIGFLLLVPGLVLVAPGDLFEWSMSSRRLLTVGIVLVAVVIALPSAAGNSLGMADDAVPDGAVAVGDYRVSYAENVSHGRVASNDSGLIVVNERRYIWSTVASTEVLEHQGSVTVPVGGLGWRETVEAERTGWNVVGNDSVYVVDLETDDTVTRSFTSEQSRSSVTVANRTVTLVPGDEAFRVTVTQDGETLDSVPVPEMGATVAAGGLEVLQTERQETATLVVSTDSTEVVVAQKE